MHLNITDSEKGDNKGSCAPLVHYLDKENRMKDQMVPELWFNGENSNIDAYEVKTRLDQNIAKLCRDEAKFFLLNISPSQKELIYLKTVYGEGELKQRLKAYAVKVMDEYARNFNRAGVNSHQDLLWYGKVEKYRYYTHKDKEVKSGLKKAGERKEGEQMHVQVIVSRKDMTNKIKLSPMNNSNGSNKVHSRIVGEFNRSAFKSSGERVFDQLFDFKRGLKETFEYANVQQNGSLEQRLEMQRRLGSMDRPSHSEGLRIDSKIYLPAPEPTRFLDLLLEKADYDPLVFRSEKRKRRKRKPGQSTEQSL